MADDNDEERALLVTMLSSLGHDVVAEVGTCRAAVERVLALGPDAVLLDVYMPDGSGIDAAKQIGAASPGTAVLLITGDHSLVLSEEDVLETAAISFVTKPTRKPALDAALRLAVAHAKALSAARQDASAARRQLEERKHIERAKGVLMQRRNCSEQVAYEIMRRMSQDRSLPMVEVAREILRGSPGFS